MDEQDRTFNVTTDTLQRGSFFMDTSSTLGGTTNGTATTASTTISSTATESDPSTASSETHNPFEEEERLNAEKALNGFKMDIERKKKGYGRIKKYGKSIEAMLELLSKQPGRLAEAQPLVCIVQLTRHQPSRKSEVAAMANVDSLHGRAKKKAFKQVEKHWWFRRNFITPITAWLFKSVRNREQEKLKKRSEIELAKIKCDIRNCNSTIASHKTDLQRVVIQKTTLENREREVRKQQNGLTLPSLFKRLTSRSERGIYNRMQARNKALKSIEKSTKQLTAIENRLNNNLGYQNKVKKELTTIETRLEKRLGITASSQHSTVVAQPRNPVVTGIMNAITAALHCRKRATNQTVLTVPVVNPIDASRHSNRPPGLWS